MTRYALIIEYDGRAFCGWQRQEHDGRSGAVGTTLPERRRPSVQGSLEAALVTIIGTTVTLHAAGRTDAGVHAIAMRAHVDLVAAMTPFRLMAALNAVSRPLPVAITACRIVDDDWHARFSCSARHYEYRIVIRRAPLTFDRGLAWRIPVELDTAAMAVAARRLVGRHDFTTFRSAHCQANSAIRTLDRLEVDRDGDRVRIRASARSFLHHQVRSMVGCLALVGRGRWDAAQLETALEARDRAALGHNAPPDGLYFVKADYPIRIDPLAAGSGPVPSRQIGAVSEQVESPAGPRSVEPKG